MDGTSQTNVNEGVMVGDLFDDTPASYALGLLGGTTYDQPVPLASLPPSSAGAAFVPLPAPSQAGAGAAACSYPATVPPPLSNPHEIVFRQLQQQHHRRQQEVEQELRAFWAGQLAEAAAAEMSSRPPVHHSLPLARIKKIMKADKDVKMIAAEAPVVFAKACEMFILELTLRAWLHAGGTRRRTLHGSDVAAVITSNEAYDFLIDIMPEEEHRSGDVVPPPPLPSMMTTEHRSGDVVPPPPLPSTMTPSYGLAPAASSVPFAVYANNMQPVTYMWATPEHHQQNSDGGRDRQDY